MDLSLQALHRCSPGSQGCVSRHRANEHRTLQSSRSEEPRALLGNRRVAPDRGRGKWSPRSRGPSRPRGLRPEANRSPRPAQAPPFLAVMPHRERRSGVGRETRAEQPTTRCGVGRPTGSERHGCGISCSGTSKYVPRATRPKPRLTKSELAAARGMQGEASIQCSDSHAQCDRCRVIPVARVIVVEFD